MYKYDHYTNYNCVSGNCPLIVEEEKYGIRTSTCDDYCGTGFGGCSTCYFEESDLCNECVHNKEGKYEKIFNDLEILVSCGAIAYILLRIVESL